MELVTKHTKMLLQWKDNVDKQKQDERGKRMRKGKRRQEEDSREEAVIKATNIHSMQQDQLICLACCELLP